MTTKAKKKFRSTIAEAAHETASGLRRIGLIDAKTMREFDAACLTTIEPLTGKQILALREREGVVCWRVERKAETGERMGARRKKPSGPSLKLLLIVKAHGLEAII